jgi:hypothetical protein
MAARLSALCAGHFLTLGRFLVLISVRGWVNPRAVVWLEGLGRLKKFTSSGTQTGHLPACSKAPQPTTLQCAPNLVVYLNLKHFCPSRIHILIKCDCSRGNNQYSHFLYTGNHYCTIISLATDITYSACTKTIPLGEPQLLCMHWSQSTCSMTVTLIQDWSYFSIYFMSWLILETNLKLLCSNIFEEDEEFLNLILYNLHLT